MSFTAMRQSFPERLFLIRHGATDWSTSGRHTGRTDIPLNAAGQTAARALRSRLEDLQISAAFASPLQRALETAALCFAGQVIECEDLMEWDYGAYEGRTTVEIQREFPGWHLWRDGCPGGESAEDVGRRADRVLGEIAQKAANDENVMVFGHGHMLRVLAIRWLGLAPHQGYLLKLDTASVSVLDHEHGLEVISRWNS